MTMSLNGRRFGSLCGRQDWFHGRCVGVLQTESQSIDEYVCPRCDPDAPFNYANMRTLCPRDYDEMRKLVRQLQQHKSAWPFREPVSARDVPDYHRIIKEPMDLRTVDQKIQVPQPVFLYLPDCPRWCGSLTARNLVAGSALPATGRLYWRCDQDLRQLPLLQRERVQHRALRHHARAVLRAAPQDAARLDGRRVEHVLLLLVSSYVLHSSVPSLGSFTHSASRL